MVSILGFEFQKPEVTTVVRWMLRVVLVLFLAWLIRRKPDEDDEDEQPQEARRVNNGLKQRSGASARPVSRFQQQQAQREQSYQNQRVQQRDPYGANTLRNRRGIEGAAGGGPGVGGPVDFDAVIDKMSKPKELWGIKKEGGHSQIVKRPSDKANNSTSNNDDAGSVSSVGSGSGGGSNVGSNSALSGLKKPSAAARHKAAEEASRTLHGHERPVTFITLNRESNLLFTCGKDKLVTAWSFPDGECLGVYRGHAGAVWACSVTADSSWLVTGGADRLVIIWEARTTRELARIELPGVVRFVEWAGTSSGGEDGSPKVEKFVTCHNRFGAHPASLTTWRFDGETIEVQIRISTLPGPANQVRWGRGDYLLASAHENGELIFWRADTGAEVRRLQAHSAAVSKFDFSSDKEVVATASLDSHVKVWDLGKGSEWKLLFDLKTDRSLNAVALAPLSRSCLVAAEGKRPTGCAVIAAGGQDARDVALKGAGSEQFGTLLFKLGEEEALEAIGVTKGHFGPVHALAYARDGKACVSGSEDGCVRIHLFEGAEIVSGSVASAQANATGA
eukprot:TRINITY_DN74370_c0_g1_i1.p1 TRINITY_DN74370_c0_g1~~TRINITY_DN74370_c0_g1_i1.p1  ORF type:complete len:562 (+),score=125.76 TRINITY_DN74370_c0_g1_i1:180-1865(+)